MKDRRRFGRNESIVLLCASALVVVCGYGGATQAAAKLRVLCSFTNLRGAFPHAGLVGDGAGNFFGTTLSGGANGAGVVFELSPPGAGKIRWTEKVLHNFEGARGDGPAGSLIVDGAGNLYGTTQDSTKGDGLVFELSPPEPGMKAWTETVLHTFKGTEGANPQAGLVADGAGNLYGTTVEGGGSGAGVVFELSPPTGERTVWTETVLRSFNGGADGAQPNGSLILDGAGVLYGTTASGGAGGAGLVFEMIPPAEGRTAWTEKVLRSFDGGTQGGYPTGG